MLEQQQAQSTAVALIQQAPAIIAAITGLVAAVAAINNGRKAKVAASAAAEAADKAEVTAAKADQIHLATTRLTQQANTIQMQTDGQLSRVMGTNEALRDILTKFLSILSAREGKALAVRQEDLRSGEVDLSVPSVDTGGNGHGRRQDDPKE